MDLLDQSMISVGIDLGTSTTKLIISRLHLARVSSPFALPRYDIIERQLLYASPVYTTPLLNEDEIDAAAIHKLIQEEYSKAGIMLSEIRSGAVIITGETATKKNAGQVLQLLAERAGDFVVATAGADLEALLAGKGSGAASRSRDIRGIVANIDVGGGTANTALFHRGELVAAMTCHVGGRLIRINRQGLILAVSAALRPWLDAKGFRIVPGEQVSYSLLHELAMELSRSMFSCLTARRSDPVDALLITGEQPESLPPIDQFSISGGVGRMIDNPPPLTIEQTAEYGDFGPLLAYALKKTSETLPFQRIQPQQTVGATVMGAGMQSVVISGSTVYADSALLPLRNVPILKLELTEAMFENIEWVRNAMVRTLEWGARLYDQKAEPPFALFITGRQVYSYDHLQLLADLLSEYGQRYGSLTSIMVIVCESDMAKALGQALAPRLPGMTRLICIDQVSVAHGDYLDIGKPIAESMIPVVVKTLAFNRQE